MIARLFLTVLLALSCLVAGARELEAQSCSFSATNVNFGAVDTLGSGNTDTVGTITISCSAFLGLLSSISMTINIGEGRGGANSSTRQMTSLTTATPLTYQLYSDSARTQVFGSNYGSYGGSPVTLSGGALLTALTTSSVQVQLYGRAPGGQTSVVPGTYLSRFDRNPQDVRVDYRTCNLLLFCTDRVGTFTFDVLATVSPNCLVTAGDLNFGSVGLLNTNIDASSQISVTCTAMSDYNIGLDHGLHGSGPGDRVMEDIAGNRIHYELFQNAGRTLVWGTLAGGAAQASSGSGTTQMFSVFGRVPPQTTPPPGLYSDTIVVTVTY